MQDFKIDDNIIAYSITIIKNLILFAVFVYIFLINFKDNISLYEDMTKYEYEARNYSEQFPILEAIIDKNKSFPSPRELLQEKLFYINDSFLTNDYIKFIRKIPEVEDQIYKEASSKTIEIREIFDMNRPGQINFVEFNSMNSLGKLNNPKRYNIWETPFVSVIIPFYNQDKEIIKTIRSIQNQSLKNIEIIIIDDNSDDRLSNRYFNYFLKTDPRIRVFYHLEHMGEWRSRLDGFLYSKGRYILQYNANSPFIDNFALEDIYYIATKYKVDSVRFSYQKTQGEPIDNIIYNKEFSNKDLQIRYGKCDYGSYFFDYGYLGNRLIRASVITKVLMKIDPIILNAYKNLWTDVWWNELANLIDTTYVSINRDVFLYFESKYNEIISKFENNYHKELIIREYIYFWVFTYETLPKNNNKKELILEMKSFSEPNNIVKGKIVTIDNLKNQFYEYEYLLKKIINDEYVSDDDKKFVRELLSKYESLKG